MSKSDKKIYFIFESCYRCMWCYQKYNFYVHIVEFCFASLSKKLEPLLFMMSHHPNTLSWVENLCGDASIWKDFNKKQINEKNGRKSLIIGCYRPPNSNLKKSFEELELIMEIAHLSNLPTIITGDKETYTVVSLRLSSYVV